MILHIISRADLRVAARRRPERSESSGWCLTFIGTEGGRFGWPSVVEAARPARLGRVDSGEARKAADSGEINESLPNSHQAW